VILNRSKSTQLLSAFFVSACIACFWVYRHALNGDFISDDSFFIIGLASDHRLDWNFVANVFYPYSDIQYEVMSYGPLYLLTSRIEWEVFGANTLGYHIVNVVLHALNATLLVALMRREGIDTIWALIGGAFFALHPASVEVVAWINQLRSIPALGFALGSLLALRKHPGLSAGLFAAGLLFKVSALFALPVALTLWWCSRRDPRREPISVPWLSVWVALAALFTFPSFHSVSLVTGPSFANVAELLRNTAAIGAHYMLMATTSIGLSAFHLPEPVRSWLNPWWLASLPIGLVALWRIVGGIVRGREEAAWWIGAAFAFGMVSQIIPFYYPMADRYLYFMLPGLLIASLLWWQDFKSVTVRRREVLQRSVSLADLGLRIATVPLLVLFANHSGERAGLWKHDKTLLMEAAINYPTGGLAAWVRGGMALEKGDIDAAIPELRRVVKTEYYQYVDIFGMPQLAPFLSHPKVVRLRNRVARLEIERWDKRGTETQHQMRAVGSAYFLLGKHDLAIATLEAALRRGGPHRAAILADLELIREAKRNRRAAVTR